MLVLQLTDAHVLRTVIISISSLSLSRRCASTAQTTATRRTGTWCTSACVFFLPSRRYSADGTRGLGIGSGGQGFASRGAGGIVMEATAVVPEGRISPEDAGLWTDSQIAPLRRIVDFAHTQTAKVGVQLAHAGRKASTLAMWVDSSAVHTHHVNTSTAFANEGGWPDNGTPHILSTCDGFVRCSLTCRARSLWACDCSLVRPVPNPQGDDRGRYTTRHRCVCRRGKAGCSGWLCVPSCALATPR